MTEKREHVLGVDQEKQSIPLQEKTKGELVEVLSTERIIGRILSLIKGYSTNMEITIKDGSMIVFAPLDKGISEDDVEQLRILCRADDPNFQIWRVTLMSHLFSMNLTIVGDDVADYIRRKFPKNIKKHVQ